MKTIFKILLSIIISIGYIGCAADKNCGKNKKILVRLTTYSRTEKIPKRHPDKWSRLGISSTGIPLKNMQSVAVDPKIIPYFSKIKLSCLDHTVFSIDTGSWVRSRRAALRCGVNCPVIDLFFDKEKDAALFRARNPLFVEAIILN